MVPVTAPDSITTWILRAVGLSKEHGLGIGESQLRVFQPFFLTVDLPFSAIRGEEFPVKVALFNYLDRQQEMFVEIEEADWFELLDQRSKSINIRANDIGGVEFKIRPTGLGKSPVKITARSTEAADAGNQGTAGGALRGGGGDGGPTRWCRTDTGNSSTPACRSMPSTGRGGATRPSPGAF